MESVANVFSWIKAAFAAIGGVVGWFFGGADGFLYALIAFVVMDYVTGVMCAIVDKELSSESGYTGIFRKILIFALVGVGHILDSQILGDPNGGALRTAVIFFYLSNEGVSILENTAHLGLPIPEKLKNIIAAPNFLSFTNRQDIHVILYRSSDHKYPIE